MRSKRPSNRTSVKCWIYNDPVAGQLFYPLDDGGNLLEKDVKPMKINQTKLIAALPTQPQSPCPTPTLPSEPADFLRTIAQEMPELSFSPELLFPTLDEGVGLGCSETIFDPFDTWK
jgi:hypothetical protein